MITSIRYENFKGATANLDIAPITLITGKNFAGKTTVIQALTLALTGTVAGLGKTAANIFQASSGKAMFVEAGFSDGTRVTRDYKQTGKKGAVKCTVEGTAPAINLMCGEDFTNAKPSARLAMLASHASGNTEDLAKTLATYQKKFSLAAEGETIFELAENVIEAISELQTTARARKVQFEKTINGLVEMNKEAASPPPANTAQAVQDAFIARSAAERASADAEQASEKAQDAKALLEELINQIPGAATAPAGVQELMEQLEDLKEELDNTKPTRLDLEQLEENRSFKAAGFPPEPEHYADLDDLEFAEKEWNPDCIKDQDAEIKEANYWIEKEQTSIKNAETRLKDVEAAECCTQCGSDRLEWKASQIALLKESISESLIEIDAQRKHIEEAEGKKADLEKQLALLDLLPALRYHRGFVLAVELAEKWLPEAEPRFKAAEEAAAAIEEKIIATRAKINSFETNRSAHERYLRLSPLAATADDESARLKEAYAKEAAAVEAHEKAQADHDAAEEQRRAWDASQRRVNDLNTARTEADKEEATLKELTLAAAAITASKDEHLRKLYGPVVEVARALSEGLLRTPLDLHPRNGQIGRYEGVSFIPFALMSGAEQIVALAALQTALALGGSRILILDEISRMDDTTKAKFIPRLEALVNEVSLLQVIVLDYDASQYGPAWQIHEV